MIRRICTLAGIAGVVAVFGGTSPAQAAFPGANGKIAFSDFQLTGSLGFSDYDVYTMEPDGTGIENLTSHPQNPENPDAELNASWSPDGREIAFGRSFGGAFEIFVMNLGGGESTCTPQKMHGNQCEPITSGPAANDAPAWSPDGKKIVFTSFRDAGPGEENSEIYVMNRDGTDQTRITNTPGRENAPAWSPDGKQIAFNCDSQICVMNVDGTGRRQITSGDGVFDPAWSPDGTRIAYQKGNFRSSSESLAEVYVSEADGGNEVQLTNNVGRISSGEPAWSPDGTKIVFVAFNIDSTDLWVMNSDGSGLSKIRSGLMPDWQPLNRPPNCSSVTATPSSLFPASRKFVLVSLNGGTDPDGDAVTISITGARQDEPVTAPGDPTSPDASAGAAPNQLNLRAERNPQADGRVYRIAFSASDGRGGTCSGTATVSVPRHTHEPAVDSAPPSYDSFGS